MSDHDSPLEIQKSVKRYLFVFYALIVGTIVTVMASRFHIDSVALTVAIALFIACIKGFLVAGYFMHLISEKKMIYGILIATVFFFTGLMFLTVWSMDHNSLIHMAPNVP
jgi:cytochrome c oxidase subunit 4